MSTCSGGSGECPAVPKINGVLIRDTPPQPDVRLTRNTPQPPDRQPATRADTSSVRQTPSSPRRRPTISHSQADAQLARQTHPAFQADNARHWRYRFLLRISASCDKSGHRHRGLNVSDECAKIGIAIVDVRSSLSSASCVIVLVPRRSWTSASCLTAIA